MSNGGGNSPGPSAEAMAENTKQLKLLRQGMIDAKAVSDDFTQSFGKFLAAGAESSQRVGDISNAYEQMQRVVGSTSAVIEKLTGSLGGIANKLPVIGGFAKGAIDAIGGISTAFAGLAEFAVGAPAAFVTALDDQTRGLRAFESEMFNIHKRFGGTIDESNKFANSLRKAADNPLAKSLHMTTGEMSDLVRATARTQLTQEQLSKTVQTGAGTIELFGAAAAFARASSMSFGQSAGLLNTLMNKQGKSAQEATNMLGMYIGVAEETGLSIDKVADSLNSAVQNFAKIGMAADFGKPIMQGFSATMKDMGLGIEEAIGLSNGLTSSLASLTNNYGMAYLTFQRGGLDIGGGGGGGVLGSSIALQSAYLDAEKTGDQAAISDQLVRGMRDTLASFTGGDIVTVQQANEDSSLQNQFYIQQQMLKSNFGIQDDNSAARVLDMLSRLDEATRSGDVEAQEKLKEQIEKEKRGTDLTLDEMEKVNRKLEIQINLMTLDMRQKLNETRRMASAAGGELGKHMRKPAAAAEGIIEMEAAALKKITDVLGLDPKSKAYKIAMAKDSAFFADARSGPRFAPEAADRADAIRARKFSGRGGEREMKALLAQLMGLNPVNMQAQGVKASDIHAQAEAIANVAGDAQLKKYGGDKGAFKDQIIKDFIASLANIKIQVDMKGDTSKHLDAIQLHNKSVDAATGNPSR